MPVVPDCIAKVSVSIVAPRSAVWKALISPAAAKKWKGKSFRDKGAVPVLPERTVQYRDVRRVKGPRCPAADHHTVTVEILPACGGGQTLVTLWEDNNPTDAARHLSEEAWAAALEDLKMFVEDEPQHAFSGASFAVASVA